MGQTSEGCPYDCTFCTVWKTHGRKVTLASLANVQHDFLSLPASVRAFFFADDIWMQASEQQIRELYDPLLDWMASDFLPRRRDLWLTVETRTDLYLREEDRFKAWIRRGGLKRILTSNFTVATPLPGTVLYAESLKESPELADRNAVSHPAFSLFTALTPTRLDVREFYEQVARAFRAANQIRFSLEAVRQISRMAVHSPWLIPRLAKAPKALRALTDPGTFLEVHRQVQGERLMGTGSTTPHYTPALRA